MYVSVMIVYGAPERTSHLPQALPKGTLILVETDGGVVGLPVDG